jgi:hypothetical protein
MPQDTRKGGGHATAPAKMVLRHIQAPAGRRGQSWAGGSIPGAPKRCSTMLKTPYVWIIGISEHLSETVAKPHGHRGGDQHQTRLEGFFPLRNTFGNYRLFWAARWALKSARMDFPISRGVSPVAMQSIPMHAPRSHACASCELV